MKAQVSYGLRSAGPKIGRLILDSTVRVAEDGAAIALGVMTIIITWQVFSRKFLNVAPYWSEETAIILMVWFGLLGAAVGVRRRVHIALEFVTSLFPSWLQQVNQVVVDLLVLAFSLFMVIEGADLVSMSRPITTPALRISQSYVYLVIPISGALMALYALEWIVSGICAWAKGWNR